jgi:hypothetical protein
LRKRDGSDGGTDWRRDRVLIAERFPGWTLEYIDGLSLEDKWDIDEVLAAKGKAEAAEAKLHR